MLSRLDLKGETSKHLDLAKEQPWPGDCDGCRKKRPSGAFEAHDARAVCAFIWAKRPERSVGCLWRRTAGPGWQALQSNVDVLIAIDALEPYVEMRPTSSLW